jgi:hypothetical protein
MEMETNAAVGARSKGRAARAVRGRRAEEKEKETNHFLV